MSDDTPTQRFDQQPAAVAEGSRKKRSPLIPLLITVGAILLVAVVVLVVLLLGRNSTGTLALSTNTPSVGATTPPPTTPVSTPVDTPTATQSATSTQAPPPPDTTLGFTTFLVQSKINSCSSGPYYTGTPPIIKVTWATKNAVSAWIVQGTSDAADSGFMQIPLHGTQANFPYEIDFQCGSPSSTFTITLVGKNGQHLSKHWTVVNTTPNG